MDMLAGKIREILEKRPGRIVLSAPRPGAAATRAAATPRGGGWQVERLADNKAFHENIDAGEFPQALVAMLTGEFSQLTATAPAGEYRLRVTGKGKVLTSRSLVAGQQETENPARAKQAHNKAKNYLLPEGEPIPPLVDMGVLTPDGRVVKAMYDKFRQVNRFVELVDDELRKTGKKKLRVVDFGCGKSSLTFVLYYFLTRVRGLAVEMTGLDLKADVVARCNEAAKKYGYESLRFLVGDIAAHEETAPVDMVVSLHACDTATDHALARAVAWKAAMIFSVPCCQHELNAQMQGGPLPIFTRYGIAQERTAALMTDAIRANLLTACGYKTQLLEFVDLSHTPKNLLIRARRAPQPAAAKRQAKQEVADLCGTFTLSPTLQKLLEEQGELPR